MAFPGEIFNLCQGNSQQSINQVNENEESPLFEVVRSSDLVFVHYLILSSKANIKKINKNRETAFHIAVEEKNKKMALLLKDLGADINAQDYNGYTAFFRTVINKDKDMARFLKGLGVDINAKIYNGHTAFFCTVMNEDKDMARFLKGLGVDMNVTDYNGCTAFL